MTHQLDGYSATTPQIINGNADKIRRLFDDAIEESMPDATKSVDVLLVDAWLTQYKSNCHYIIRDMLNQISDASNPPQNEHNRAENKSPNQDPGEKDKEE